MAYIDFLSPLHKATKRDYLARVNDPEYPKARAAELAKQWGYDYWTATGASITAVTGSCPAAGRPWRKR